VPAFRVTGISDDWYRSTMGVIVIGLVICWSTREIIRCTWQRGEQSCEDLGAPATTLGEPRMTVEQSQKNNIFFGNAAGAPGNQS